MNNLQKLVDDLCLQLKEMLPYLRAEYHLRMMEIFGSFVRGEACENSDLDLLVTFDEDPSLFKFIALENYLSDALGVNVDLVMKDSLKPGLRAHILDEALLL
jgi:hypothetical protein